MRLPPDSVSECIMFIGCAIRPFIRLSVRFAFRILSPQYLMNGLNSFDKTYREYSLAPTDDLIRFWRS